MSFANINNTTIKHIWNTRMMTVLFLGFSSGLPLALSTGTLQAWLADVDVDIRTIGWFSLAGLPYTLKFIWSPLMDRFVPNTLGRRRGWMFLTQCALLLLITSMAFMTPESDLKIMGMIAFFIAFCSASQDIAFDAYRTDILPPPERGLGAAVSVAGYRIAMLLSGAGARGLPRADRARDHPLEPLLVLRLLLDHRVRAGNPGRDARRDAERQRDGLAQLPRGDGARGRDHRVAPGPHWAAEGFRRRHQRHRFVVLDVRARGGA